MSGVTSCRQCGCSEIDTDPSRGDAVCTNCGFVLEESIIVSEVTFEEDGHGGASAVGQFVSAESRGGGGMGAASGGFHSGVAKESRELTLRAAKKKIVEVAQQLRLNQHCIDVAFNFFKMALHKQLTKGRKNSLTIAACVYMTCRIEGTPHLLIDFSDVVQMDVYALGRAYVQISRALYINIPAVDPCMYILRFAHKFDLGDKTHEVAMTALRLVQRMKRDWIHLGRRPSGLCGAALLIAGRLHGFSRSVQDVIGVVKVHETTLRKRLVEFGETPSSSLTLDEFMSVDLEEEHDPPSFKAARVKDRERLQKLLDEEVSAEFLDIQRKIDEELDKRRKKVLNKSSEEISTTSTEAVQDTSPVPSPILKCTREVQDTTKFIMESTITAINDILEPVEKVANTDQTTTDTPNPINANTTINVSESVLQPANADCDIDRLLMPPPNNHPVNENNDRNLGEAPEASSEDGELELEGIDDCEINSYIMDANEVRRKTAMWEEINSDYIALQRQKQDQLEKDKLEGKQEKKKRKKPVKQKSTFQAKSANEAIKIMLMERKMSNKINYDVLRTLTSLNNELGLPADLLGTQGTSSSTEEIPNTSFQEPITVIESGPIVPNRSKRNNSQSDTEHAVPPPKKSKSSKSRKISTEVVKIEKIASPISKVEPESVQLAPTVFDQSSNVQTETAAPGEVIVESGPVRYVDDEQNESEDEEESFSASRLLTQFRGEEEPSYDDYYD